MKKQPLIFSLFLLFPLYIKAQSTAPKPDRQKHEFALDIQDVFNGFLYRHNLIYKRRLEGKKTVRLDQTSRLRLQLGLRGQVPISDTSHVGATSYFRATPQLNLSLGVGYEVQKPIKEKFEVIYGADLIGSYYRTRANRLVRIINSVEYEVTNDGLQKLNNIEVGTTPFVGFNYAINSYLRIGIETGLHIRYYYNNREERGDSDPDFLLVKTINTGIYTYFDPIRFVNLSVRF